MVLPVKCPQCGAEAREAAKRCRECGVALPEASPTKAELPADVPKVLSEVYRLEALIGEGSMGRVFRARHNLTDQVVAIKALPSWCAQREDVRGRFLSEGRALSLLEHPNVVRMHTFLEQDGRLYLVMEHVYGRNLDERLEAAGPLGSDDAVDVAGQVLAGLAHLHSRGMIHRDIKPGNIRVGPDGAVKLMDLGLAQMRYGATSRHTGFTAGTLAYMSPEQAKGKALDARSDLYSFGATLFEALSGRLPFCYDNDFEVRRAHASETPPRLEELVPQASFVLCQAVAKALEKQPAKRFQNADEFRQALGLPAYRIVSVADDRRAAAPPTGLRGLRSLLTAGPAAKGGGDQGGAPRPGVWWLAAARGALLLVAAVGLLLFALSD